MRERKLAITTKISKWLFFLSIASLLLLSTSCDQEDTSGIDGDEDWSFLVYGDLRQGFSIYDVLINSMTRLNPTPAFAVCNGDIMATPNNEVEWLAFWNHTEKLTRQMPVHIVRGNHEGNSPEDERIFREQTKLKTSNIYYSFIENNSLFVLLDTEVPGEVAGILNKQLTWLTNTLDQAKKNDDIIRIFIFMHRPLFPQGAHYGEDMHNAHELHDMFIQHEKIRAVFVSHDHLFNRHVRDGIEYITTGGAGAHLHHGRGGDYHHYIKVSITNHNDRVNLKTVGIFHEVVENFDL